MSQPESPALTELQQMWAQLDEVNQRLDNLTHAVNGLGENVQWIIDNTKGIFQMFSSPSFMQMLPKMMSGGMAAPGGGGGGAVNAGQGNDGTSAGGPGAS